jgi:hypothetical protein
MTAAAMRNQIEKHLAVTNGLYLLAPVPMTSSHTDGHLPEIGYFLSLEAVQVRLDRGT